MAPSVPLALVDDFPVAGGVVADDRGVRYTVVMRR
jgi:hypothetical protein